VIGNVLQVISIEGVLEKLGNNSIMSTNSDSMSKCAACGKGGDNLKVCTSCEQVSYCNAKCRKAHRPKHKKECRQLAAERHNEETAIINIDVDAIIEKFSKIEVSDEELFADPPPKEDCDICMLIPMRGERIYQSCCGKILCYGCMSASNDEMNKGNMKRCCPFCRFPLPRTEMESVVRVKKRMAAGDAEAFLTLGGWYERGKNGLPQDNRRAFELYSRGAELGSFQSHCSLASAYLTGEGVEQDDEKAVHHLMLASIGGSDTARSMLGDAEANRGTMERAMKHYMIAAKRGHDDSMKEIGLGYKAGKVTKDEYASTLRAHRASRDEMKSKQKPIAEELG